MSALSDNTILEKVQMGELGISPLDGSRVQPASVDLTLGNEFLFTPKTPWIPPVDWDRPVQLGKETVEDIFDKEVIDSDTYWKLDPRDFVLGTTQEWVDIPDDLLARVEGKSSLGRMGLLVHATAGFIDPGFKGRITLELYNLFGKTLALYPGMAICQLSFFELDKPAVHPYGHDSLKSKYQNQSEVTSSRYGA